MYSASSSNKQLPVIMSLTLRSLSLYDHPALIKFYFSKNGLNKAAYFMYKEKKLKVIN